MPKIQFSDITPPEKRSIRNVPIPNSGRRRSLNNSKPIGEPVENPGIKITKNYSDSDSSFQSETPEIKEKKIGGGAYEYYYPKNKSITEKNQTSGRSKKKTWIFGVTTVLAVCVFIIGMMTIFSSATIEITPKTQKIAVSSSVEISPESKIKYEVVKLSKTKSSSVAATSEEMAEIKASGKIVIYNDFSSEPQRLITRTRFESPEGLIYRIPESIVVPGKTTKDGVSIPGSVEVEVFADEAGEKYNIKKTDFTIPGFKNDSARYKSFYARSSTEITGGFIGKRKTVLQSDKDAALEKIEADTKAELAAEFMAKVPDDLVLLNDAIKYESSEMPAKEDGSSVVLSKEVTAYALLVNKKELSKFIIDEYVLKIPDWSGIEALVSNFSNIKATLPENTELGGKISLQIDGEALIQAAIDTNLINQKLVGQPKSKAKDLTSEFSGISKVKSIIRPIWKQNFPNDSFRIHVNITANE